MPPLGTKSQRSRKPRQAFWKVGGQGEALLRHRQMPALRGITCVMSAFVVRTITHSVIAETVAGRSSCPVMDTSLRKLPIPEVGVQEVISKQVVERTAPPLYADRSDHSGDASV
jgi:hypothetical protein